MIKVGSKWHTDRDILVHPIEVRGEQHRVWVDPQGRFIGEIVDGDEVHGANREDLYRKLMTATKRRAVKIAVPISQLAYKGYNGVAYIRTGVLTGIHSGNGNALVQWNDKVSGTEQPSPSSRVAGRLTAQEQAEWLRLVKASRDAKRALDSWESERLESLRDRAEAAIKAAVEAEEPGTSGD